MPSIALEFPLDVAGSRLARLATKETAVETRKAKFVARLASLVVVSLLGFRRSATQFHPSRGAAAGQPVSRRAEAGLTAESGFSVREYVGNLVWSNRLFGRGGSPPFRNRVRFFLRCLLHPKASHLWFSYLRSRAIPRRGTPLWEILQYPHKPFFDQQQRPIEKARLLTSSYEFCRAIFGDALFHALIEGEKLQLAELSTKHAETVRLYVSQDRRFLREGTLSLSIAHDREAIVSLSYTFALLEGNRVALVGCVQATAQDALPKIRRLTKECFGIQPRLLLIEVLRSLCSLCRIDRIEAVGNENHIYRTPRYRRKKNISMNYDALWEMAGGRRQSNGNYFLPLRSHGKPLETYPSRKRAEHRNRHRLVETMDLQIRAALWMRRSTALGASTLAALREQFDIALIEGARLGLTYASELSFWAAG